VVKLWLVALAACSSGAPKPTSVEPDREHRVETPVGAHDGGGAAEPGGKGELAIRIEWHDVPVAARASPGRTPCGTARAAAVAPTTMWGVPDAFVALDAPGAAPASAPRIVLDHCALSPRVAVGGARLEVTTTIDEPVELAIAKRGELRDPNALAAPTSRAVQLPIAGHVVAIDLDAGGLYELTGRDLDSAWLIAAPGPFVAVTDATGQAVLRDVPSGTYAVTAWLPARSGQPARIGRGQATVTAGALAEVTVNLDK
jgi:hypothetical protein